MLAVRVQYVRDFFAAVRPRLMEMLVLEKCRLLWYTADMNKTGTRHAQSCFASKAAGGGAAVEPLSGAARLRAALLRQ